MEKKHNVKRYLILFLALIMIIGSMPLNIFAETYETQSGTKTTDWSEEARKKEEAETGNWPLSKKNRLVRVSPADPVKTPNINYIGVYTNTEGREVVRFAFNAHVASANQWDKLLIKLPKVFDDMVDHQHPFNGIYKGKPGYGNHDSADSHWAGYKYSDAKAVPEKLGWDLAGSKHVYAFDLYQNSSMSPGNMQLPIDFVLKDGQSIKSLKADALVQARLTDNVYERVYTRHGEITFDYMQYTMTTIIPKDKNFGIDVNTDLTYQGIQNPGYSYSKFFSTVSSVKFNVEKGYLEVYNRQTKWATGSGYAIRQSVGSDFYNLLDERNGMVGEVYIMGASAQPYSSANEDPYEPATKIQFARSDINENLGKNIGFLQVVGSNWDNSKEYANGIKSKKSSNVYDTDAILNTTTAQGNAGVYTVVRYFIKPEELKKLIKENGLKSYTFRTSFLRPNEHNYGTGPVVKGISEYNFTADKERNLKRGDKVEFKFDKAQYNRNVATYVTFIEIIVGDKNYNIGFRDTTSYDSTGLNATWTVPFDIKIKEGENIIVKSLDYDENNRATKLTMHFADDDFQEAKGEVNYNPIEMLRSVSITGGALTSTIEKPNINEIFTDDKAIRGHSLHQGAEINISFPGDKKVTETQTISAVASEKPDQDGSFDYNTIMTPAKKVNKGNVMAFPFDTSKPNSGGFVQEGKTHPEFKMPKLVKDMRVKVDNLAGLSSFIPSDSVDEKVQAKLKFDLNDGKLDKSIVSFEGYDEDIKSKELYKVARENETDPVTRIVPMNIKFADEEDYKANGFVGENVSSLDHDGHELEGNAKVLREYLAEKPGKEGYTFLGWTTKKPEGTGKEVSEEFKKLTEATSLDQVNSEENFIFSKETPVSKTITVYAAWGEYEDIVPQKPGEDKPDVPENFVLVEFKAGENGRIAENETTKYWVNPTANKTPADLKKPEVTANERFKFTGWDKEDATAITKELEVSAEYIEDGLEITPGTKLPDGVFEVKVSRDETSIKANDLYGKSYAVFKDSKLAQDKFPRPEAEENFKDPKWNVEKPWEVEITGPKEFKATATNSLFNKDKITKIEFTKDPNKMTYTEGENPEHDGLEITLTDENGNTQVVTKDKLKDFGITVSPAEDAGLTKADNGKHFVAKVNNKDGEEITANSPGTVTVNDKLSATEVIPYEPNDKENPTNPEDKNIPREDDNGKIDKSQYNVVAFKTEDMAKGSLELGELKDKEVISLLVKKGSKWDKVTPPTTKPVDKTVKFLNWDPSLPESTVEVENGKVYTAKFVKDGQEITPGTKLPDGVHEVKVLRDEKSIKDNGLYGKSYAVFEKSKLAKDKFPRPEAEENFKDPKWNEEKPWYVEITGPKDFKASARNSAFNKDKITNIEFTKDPNKMTYTEGEKPVHDGLEIALTDENGNTQVVTKDRLDEFGIIVTPAESTELAKGDNGKHFVAKVNNKDGEEITGNSPGTITVNENPVQEQSAKPGIDKAKVGDNKISGTGVPGAKVSITKENADRSSGGTEIAKDIEVKPDGTWEVKVPDGVTLEEGDKVYATQQEDGKTLSDQANETVGPKAVEKSSKPTIEQPTEGDKKIKGKGESGSDIAVELPDGTKVPGKVDKDGNWEIKVPADKKLNKDDKIKVVQKEEGKDQSDPAEETVKDKKDSEKYEPETEPVVKDKGEKASEDEIKDSVTVPGYPEDKEKPKVTIDDPRQIPDGNTPGDYDLDVTVKYPDGSEDKTKVKVTIKDKKDTRDLTIDQAYEGDDKIKGKGEPGLNVVVKLPDETELIAKVDDNGNWSLDVPKYKPLKAGDTINASKIDGKGVKKEASTIVKSRFNLAPKPEQTPEPVPEVEIPGIKYKDHYTPTYPVYVSVPDKKEPVQDIFTHEQYIFGYPDDTIRPDGDMTRAEAIAVVARIQKLDLSDKTSNIYKDTKAGMWYNAAINAAFREGYLLEKEGENIRPNDKITRAELALLISHIDKKNDKVAPFEDVKGHKFEAAINQAYGNERIKGYPDGTFKPDNSITRAEVATMLNKLYDRYPDKNFIDANQNLVHNYKDMSYKRHWGYYELVEAYHTHKFVRLANNMEEWKAIIK